ncbi:MAG: hypothetical protein M3416_00815 [Acidobacteriota bacterium]|nr:hypothetical protein [Acidobacteriota bacterium]
MRTILTLFAIAVPVCLFVAFGARQTDLLSLDDPGEHYWEECQGEGCDTEEREELHESYMSECFDESYCGLEEVRELAGRRDSINPMMDDFQGRGWTVSGCHRWGGCNYAPGDKGASGDAAFGALCTQASINQHWNDFDFDKGDWDEGFGWDDACNTDQPLARTFNALNLLDFFGTSMPAGSGNWLPWFYSYSSDQIDELDARCDFGQPNGCTNGRTFTGAQDNRTELYWPFYYSNQLNVPSRAAVIVHEARHAAGKSHNCGNCPNGSSCDTDWAYGGANYLNIMYLWWVRAQGTGLTSAVRQMAQTRGNVLLGNRFCSGCPTNQQVRGGNAPNPNACFSIP